MSDIHIPNPVNSPGAAVAAELLPWYERHPSQDVQERGAQFCFWLANQTDGSIAQGDASIVNCLRSRTQANDPYLIQWLGSEGMSPDDFPGNTHFAIIGAPGNYRITVTSPVETSPGKYEVVTRQIWPPEPERDREPRRRLPALPWLRMLMPRIAGKY